jgi:acyl transferase domain-containing protein
VSKTEDSLEGIAVIGLSGRFPGAESIDQFWRNLRDGVESIHRFTDQELRELGITPDVYNHPNYVKAGTVLQNADMFDAEFFGFYRKDAEIRDPQHRAFLECAWEALENAGHDVESYRGQIGVFAGCSPNYYGHIIPSDSDPTLVAEAYQREIANEKDYLCTLVAYKLGLRGPAMTIQTACSTSLVAVCMACQSLMTYQCDMALAGGVCINTRQRGGYFYQEGLIPSPDGHCRAFDAKAKGTVLAQGAGVVVLKRLPEALTDGDKVYAVITGFAVNNDGSDKVGFTAPSVNGQAEAIAMAQALSGFSPETITYIEAHGTGTPLGDPIEVAALNKVFREYTEKKAFCAIGSLKTNVGHMDAAAGVAGLIKTVLMLRHREIPPSLHFEEPNPEIDLADSPFYVNTRLRKWAAEGGLPLRAGVSSFGLGGTNAHIVLEEAPETQPSDASRPEQLLLVSAKTGSALDAATENLCQYLTQNPTANIADVAYTLQTGRKRFNHRRFIVCRGVTDGAQTLKSLDPQRAKTRHTESRDPAIRFMFPGQGVQYVNMGLNLYDHEPLFRRTLDHCAEILESFLHQDLRDLLYPGDGDLQAAAEALRETSFQQPAIFTIEYALAKLWEKWGVRPAAMLGHSIGEYVAACIAGVFSLEDALMLVATRGRMMQNLPGGAMLSIRLPAAEVEPKLDGKLALAAVNAPSLCVVSGPTDAAALLQTELEKENVICRYLCTSHAFHSPMMDSIVEPFAERVRTIQLSPPTVPFVSTVTGTWITPTQATDPGYWARQLCATVRFAEGIRELCGTDECVLLEVGPRATCSTLARQQAKDIPKIPIIASLANTANNDAEWTAMLTAMGQLWLAGVSINWKSFYEQERRQRVPLPTYPFERRRFSMEPPGRDYLPPKKITSPGETRCVKPPDHSPHIPSVPSLKDEVLVQLKAILEQISGIDPTSIDEHATFPELGFDSLSMLRLFSVLQDNFSLSLTLDQVLENFPSLDRLADFLIRNPYPHGLPQQDTINFPPIKKVPPLSQPLPTSQHHLHPERFTRLRKAVKMLKTKEISPLLTIISRFIFPPNNYVFYWDKFFIMRQTHFEDLTTKLPTSAIFANEQDINQLSFQLPQKADFFKRKWAEGQKCIIVRDQSKGNIIAYCWLIFDRTKFRTNSSWTFVPPSPTAIWADDAYIDEHHRLRGPYLALLRTLRKISESNNRCPIYSEIHYSNTSSLQAAKTSGAKVIRTICFFSLFGFKIFLIKDPANKLTIDHTFSLKVKYI